MIAWRLVKTRYIVEPLSAVGSARDGGRWNPPGVPMVYCSGTLSLAALEVMVPIGAGMRTIHCHAVRIDVPDGSIETVDNDALPASWRNMPCDPATQAIGRERADGRRSLLFRVPSVVVVREWNLLLNPRHASFANVRVTDTFPFAFDPRLLPKRR